MVFGVLEFPCKFGASIIKGLILSFKVKVISDAVSSATWISIYVSIEIASHINQMTYNCSEAVFIATAYFTNETND